jgi:hypothetical protein
MAPSASGKKYCCGAFTSNPTRPKRIDPASATAGSDATEAERAPATTLKPFETVKNRLPIPDVTPSVSVTAHEIVCTPLASVVVSSPNTPSAVSTPAYCDTGNSADTSLRLVQPPGLPTGAPSTYTVTVPPPGGSERREPGESTHPKFGRRR